MTDYDVTVPLPADARSVAPVELREVVEQLVLAGLRQMALTDQLQRQLAFSRAIAASLTEGVCTVDPAGRITFINAAAERLLGWLDAEVRGREAAAVLLDPDPAGEPDPSHRWLCSDQAYPTALTTRCLCAKTGRHSRWHTPRRP